MKPELEEIALGEKSGSFQVFGIDKPAFKPFWHYHPELELTLITGGNGTRFVGDHVQAYQEGDLILLGQNLPHHWVSAKDSTENRAIVIQFSLRIIESVPECSALLPFLKESNYGFHFPEPDKKMISLLSGFQQSSPAIQFAKLIMMVEELKNDAHRVKLSSVVYASDAASDRQKNRMASSINYILDHLDTHLSVEQMADFNHLTPPSFCRWFKKTAGVPFITFLNRARIERACQDLLLSDENIQSIAFSNGFESISHFNRVFKKIKGKTPKQYRLGQEV